MLGLGVSEHRGQERQLRIDVLAVAVPVQQRRNAIGMPEVVQAGVWLADRSPPDQPGESAAGRSCEPPTLFSRSPVLQTKNAEVFGVRPVAGP